MGDMFKRLCKLLKVSKLNTTAYQSNGALERTHKTMTRYLRCFCNPKNNDWDKWLPFARFVYNTTPHTMTKYTPYEILFGRKANIPGQLQQRNAPLYNYDDTVYEVKQKLQECHEIAGTNLMQSKRRRVAQQSSKANMPIFNRGDKVLLRNEKAGKLDPLWVGPYTICVVDPNGSNVSIELSRRKKIKVYVNILKVYQPML
jgi:hypothetical protein